MENEAKLKFTGQSFPEKIEFRFNYPAGYLDDDLAETLTDALKVLAIAIREARARNIESESAEERSLREALVGFSILALNEVRAFMLVAGMGIDAHARVHFRAVAEYELRVRRILDEPARAKAFFEAFGHEFRKIAHSLDQHDEEQIEREISIALGMSSDTYETGPEKRALFGKPGDVKSAMSELPDGARRYVGTFGWPSQVSHGSVLAMRDMARAIDGAGSDFLDLAGRDGYGNRLTHALVWMIVYFANHLAVRFDFGLLAYVEPIVKRALAANERLGIVSKDAERKALERASSSTSTTTAV